MKRRLLSSLITGPLVVVCMFVFSGVAAGDTVYVDPNGSADFTTIQDAINAAIDGQEVVVRPGTYVENINMSGKAITLRSTDPTDPAVITSTIIDGDAWHSVITCYSGEEPNTVISGFVITNGLEGHGGGMHNYNNSSPTITNCTFSGNYAEHGGGMFNRDSSPTVTNCTFSGNTAYITAGGMRNVYSSPTVSNCTFSGNTALGYEYSGDSGGIHNSLSSPTISNCTFSGNAAADLGGGMCNHSSSPTVTNCTFSGNTANGGGGMYNNESSPMVKDSYFCSNTPDQILGGYTDNGGNNMAYCPPPSPLKPEYEGDVDGDGDVDFDDFALMAANWLEGK